MATVHSGGPGFGTPFYKQVCEPNRPLNEGLQSGNLKGAKSLSGEFRGDKNSDEPFVFRIDLWDADTLSADDHLVKDQTVRVRPANDGVMAETVSFEDGERLKGRLPQDGRTYVRVNYETNHSPLSSDGPILTDGLIGMR
ncbi:hypothetical protein [Streptomyces fulvorobeus]|uniref:Uncharacterized protein n=1 Tax=Streptomyces fulvorobeus TaxID=284028 RepID=A0A7Y9HGB8_9ACTN|nr:hypothetical protein [Streptomyces fulvorobeus]NYE43747.1 hypothetical protein [Streptomyces fulvorobeus]